MIDDLMEIRRICFGEDDGYLRFYFSTRFTDDNTLIYVEQGRIVATLTIIPLTIKTPIRNIPAAYIYAVATLPGFRRRGFAEALSEYADKILHQREIEAVVLSPASDQLFHYYTKLGYETYFRRQKILLQNRGEVKKDVLSKIDELNASVYFRLRNQAFATGGYFAEWDKQALEFALQECRLSGGVALHLQAGGEEGFFIAYPEAEGIVVKESFLSVNLLPYVLATIKQRYGEDLTVVFYQPCFPSERTWYKDMGNEQVYAMIKYLSEDAHPLASAVPYFGLAKE